MADEKAPVVEAPKFLEDFKGTTSDQLKSKAAFISEFGFEKWQELVARSRTTTRR